MFALETTLLLPGDIVLTSADTWRSRKIRKRTDGDFSHAILYVGNGSYIHSDPSGVHSGNTQRLLFENITHAQVYRLRDRKAQLVDNVCSYARSQIGKQYSVPEAAKSTFRRSSSSSDASNRQFCSRLVAQAYAYAGIFLVPNPDYCYPKDVGESKFVYPVEDVIRKATEVERRIEGLSNPIEQQTKATNSILAEARRLSGKDIQTFEQLVIYLLEDGQHDRAITAAVRESGYLDFWKHDLLKNSWRYDSVLFHKLPIAQQERLELATTELAGAEEQLNRFIYMYELYMGCWQRSKLQYFAQEVQLYLNLVDISKKRVSVARQVLGIA